MRRRNGEPMAAHTLRGGWKFKKPHCGFLNVPLTFAESKPLFELLFSLQNAASGFDSRAGVPCSQNKHFFEFLRETAAVREGLGYN